MSRQVAAKGADASVAEATERLAEQDVGVLAICRPGKEEQVRRLQVTEAGRVIGILSHSDLAAHGADRRAGRLLERPARCGGDRRSARWLLDCSYRMTAAYSSPDG
jgi:hypothetical protein